MITVRTQLEIQQSLEERLRDTANKRWKVADIYRAMNDALQEWMGRVRTPHIYTLENGWETGQYEYDLPDFIDEPMQPQQRRFIYDWQYVNNITGQDDTWTSIPSWTVEPNLAGGRTLRLTHQAYTGEGRILWWAEAGPVPVVIPTLSATITASETILVLTTKPSIGRSGYIKLDAEWMSYAGVTEGATTLTLTNLGRGVLSTTAASHTNGASVYFGIPADRQELFQQLQDNTMHMCMRYWLTNSSSRETSHYEKQLLLYQDLAQKFWGRYVPTRPTNLRLTRGGVGDLGIGSYHRDRYPYV